MAVKAGTRASTEERRQQRLRRGRMRERDQSSDQGRGCHMIPTSLSTHTPVAHRNSFKCVVQHKNEINASNLCQHLLISSLSYYNALVTDKSHLLNTHKNRKGAVQ